MILPFHEAHKPDIIGRTYPPNPSGFRHEVSDEIFGDVWNSISQVLQREGYVKVRGNAEENTQKYRLSGTGGYFLNRVELAFSDTKKQYQLKVTIGYPQHENSGMDEGIRSMLFAHKLERPLPYRISESVGSCNIYHFTVKK